MITVSTKFQERYSRALEITDKEDAAAYWEALVEYRVRTHGGTRLEAEVTERHTLRWFVRRSDEDTKRIVTDLFGLHLEGAVL